MKGTNLPIVNFILFYFTNCIETPLRLGSKTSKIAGEGGLIYKKSQKAAAG